MTISSEHDAGAVRWVSTNPNEASRWSTPTAELAGGLRFKLQQLVENEHGRESWEDVKIHDTTFYG